MSYHFVQCITFHALCSIWLKQTFNFSFSFVKINSTPTKKCFSVFDKISVANLALFTWERGMEMSLQNSRGFSHFDNRYSKKYDTCKQCSLHVEQFTNLRAYSHQVNVGAKVKEIKEQVKGSKNKRQTSKKNLAFARREWAFTVLYIIAGIKALSPVCDNVNFLTPFRNRQCCNHIDALNECRIHSIERYAVAVIGARFK